MYRTRNNFLWWGSLLLAISVLGAIALWLQSNFSANAAKALILCLVFVFIVSLYLLVLAATLLHPAKHPVIEHLRRQKHQIVWVYSFININMPFGVEMFRLVTVWLHYRDGSQQYLRISHAYLSECMAHLETHLPHATFGYSVQKEQLYRANPVFLERD